MKKLLLLYSLFFFIGISFSNAQDWPNLNRFQDANNQLRTTENDGKRIVFMGNSITEGWINQNKSFFADNKIINRGISGQTTPQMLLRFRQDVIDLKPAAVFILAGINDIAGNTGPSTLKMIEDNLQSMVELSEAAQIEPILCTLIPSTRIPWKDNMDVTGTVIALNEWIKGYAQGKGLEVIDYYAAFADDKGGMPKKYSKDNVHPNLDGYHVMEQLVLPVIKDIRGIR